MEKTVYSKHLGVMKNNFNIQVNQSKYNTSNHMDTDPDENFTPNNIIDGNVNQKPEEEENITFKKQETMMTNKSKKSKNND